MKMKTITTVCLSLLLLSACQKNFIEDDGQSNSDERVPLGIQTVISETKAIVGSGAMPNGSKIKLFATGKAHYRKEGDLVTAENDSTTFALNGSSWSLAPNSTNIFLTADTATLYAYYPDTATLIKSSDDPKIRVRILETDSITEVSSSPVFNTAAKEVDYMAFVPADGKGRLVNNGKAGEATDDNTGKNPGSVLKEMKMEHGMTMVSFCVVKDESFKGVGELTQFVLRNASGKTVLSKGTSPVMRLKDAVIEPGTFSGAKITRDIRKGLYKAVPVGDNSKKVSCLVFPSEFVANDMEVVLTIDGTAYPAASIPINVVNKWEKSHNYTYTIKLKGSGLSITNVTVGQWTDREGGGIDI